MFKRQSEISFQKTLYKSMGKPSEPGVFPGFILFKACKHSALVNMPSHFSFSSRFNDFEELFPKISSLIRELQSALEL